MKYILHTVVGLLFVIISGIIYTENLNESIRHNDVINPQQVFLNGSNSISIVDSSGNVRTIHCRNLSIVYDSKSLSIKRVIDANGWCHQMTVHITSKNELQAGTQDNGKFASNPLFKLE